MDCLKLLSEAVLRLKSLLHDLDCSSVYRTRPMYVTDQSDFFNMVVTGFVDDSLSPHVLLERIHQIEASLGRDRSREIRNGPRSIDIDIELFGKERIRTADLEIPHPRIAERAFVLVPMLEILPKSADTIDSTLSAPIKRYARRLKVSGSGGIEKCMDAVQFKLLV